MAEAMKSKVSCKYRFQTAELYPRWMVMCLDEMDFMEDDKLRMVRLDHRFTVDGEWKWITADARVTGWDRKVMAQTIRALRSEILHLKHNS